MNDDPDIHRKNRSTLARELRAMAKLWEPYQKFSGVSPIVLGIWHLAAWYLEDRRSDL